MSVTETLVSPTPRALRLCVGAILIAAAGAALPAQSPVFRTGVNLVTVDATVVTAGGDPDETLGPDDFHLKVDGRTRRVVSAQFIRQSHDVIERLQPLPQHFSSNEFTDSGRLIVLAVDEPHIRRLEGRAALHAAATFISHLDPADRVAAIGLARGGRIEFTRDRAAVSRRLATLTGQGDTVRLQFNIGLSEALPIADGARTQLAEVVLRECGHSLAEYLNPARAADDTGGGRDGCVERVEQEAQSIAQQARTQARISLSALEGLIDALKEFDRPKTLVLLSEGIVADARLIDFAELSAAAQAARVTIYVLHLETPLFEAATERQSPTFLKDAQVRADGLARLAGSARGAMFRLVGSDPAPFQRIARELAGHYLLAFEPLDSERDGRLHRIEVSLAKRRGEIRARQAFRMPAAVASSRAREEDLVALLRGAGAVADLPVRVATYSYTQPGAADLRVVVSIEADGAADPSPHVLLGYVLVNQQGVIVASGAHRSEAGRHAFTTKLPQGTYTLRVGAIDALQRRGLAQRAFTAAVIQHHGVQVSDLILAPVPSQPHIPLHPLVDRVEQPQVVAYAELSSNGRLLRDLQIRFEVLPENSTAPQLVVPGELIRGSDRWAATRAVLAIDSLPAGRYVAVARVLSGEDELVRTTRPFTRP